MKNPSRLSKSQLAQKLLDENSKKYRYCRGLIFFRPNKTVGIAFMSCALTGLLAANALPYDEISTSALILASTISAVYAAFHLVSSSTTKL